MILVIKSLQIIMTIYMDCNQTFIISQIYRVIRPLGEKLDFSVPWNLKPKATFTAKPPN